ncbi:MAG: STAS domain-containing protein [Candidatus Eremiobacteraeota bacterium]|nr:STAS domain-containing protein [Candidatus Eremiobacteraeota bacterium]MCW5869085.1 STAS domain-containing protein [Candidatus Eremiobacteraeota bacterium]
MQQQIQINSRVNGGVAILHLQGKLDAISVAEFREEAQRQVRAGHRRIVLDFAGVDHVDGQGLAGMFAFYRRLTVEHKGLMAIAGLNPELRVFFDRTALTRVIPVAYEWQEAAREVRS